VPIDTPTATEPSHLTVTAIIRDTPTPVATP
jgi:hypothetical protein